MASRLELHELLCDILGSRSVYFQPPESVKLTFPAIVYYNSSRESTYANDMPYLHKKKYTITVIDRNPDSIIPDKIGELYTSAFDRTYISNNLYHNVYTLFY